MNAKSKRGGVFARLLAAAAALLAPAASVAQFPDPALSFPHGTSFRVDAGQSTMFVFDVHNIVDATAMILVGGHFGGAPGSFGEYAFEPAAEPRCSLPAYSGSQPGRITLTVGPLAAGESVRCAYRVVRNGGSRNDLRFDACSGAPWVSYCYREFLLGSLPDMELVATPAEPVALGATSALVRLTALNPSGLDVAARSITTECIEFEFGQTGPFPFDFENDFPGACPTTDQREGCLNFTGDNYDSRGFLIGPTPAGGATSCLLRLRMREPLTAGIDLEMYFTEAVVLRSDGGRAFDPTRANGVVRVGAIPGGTGNPAAAALPLSDWAAALLALLLAVAAAAALRRSVRI